MPSYVLARYSPQPRVQGDEVLLSPVLWGQIKTDAHGPDSLYVSLRSASRHTRERNKLPGIICRARLDDSTDEVVIPSRYPFAYPQIFPHGRSTAHVALACVQPIYLTEVVVAALSPEAYSIAQSDALLEYWCSGRRIIRCGDLMHHEQSQIGQPNGHAHCSDAFSAQHTGVSRYRVDMTEPVQQGLVNEDTRFIVTYDPESDNPGRALPSQHGVQESPSEDESSGYETDSLEIDEQFLANGVDGLDYAPIEIIFSAKTLTEVLSGEEDKHTVYLRTSDLTKLGSLVGDWAVARSPQSSKRRLVRVQVRSDLNVPPGTVFASPVLIHNIWGTSPHSSAGNFNIALAAGPFKSHDPAIPTANSIVIARIASPLTTARKYADACFSALKTYLHNSVCLIKQGDIISIPLNTDEVRFTASEEYGETTSPYRTEVAYFLVTNVDCEVKINEDLYPPDLYTGSTLGELGCWVDSNITRVNQAGVEQSWVPSLGSYAELDLDHPASLLARVLKMDKPILLAPDSPYDKLLAITSASLARNAVEYNLNLSVVLKGARGTGKFTAAVWVAHKMGMHLLEVNCYDLIGQNEATTEGTLRARFDKAVACSPCILVLRYIEAFAQSTQPLEPGKEPAIVSALHDCINEAQLSWKMTGYPILVAGTTSELGHVPAKILSTFKNEIVFEAPTEPVRYEILDVLLTNSSLASDVSVSELALQSAGLVAADLVSLVSRTKSISMSRTKQAADSPLFDLLAAGMWLTGRDFTAALGQARATYSKSIGAPSIPKVTWDDVGGLVHAKKDILDTIQLPLDHPELFSSGLKKRSGILLYGPPGTGKTLLAKAVATSCSLNFFSVKGPELLNMYIGESEANVRRVFQKARDARPCVIFFDELDSIAPKRGNHGDSGGVMDRIVSQLLAELDGMSSGDGGADVFVIGATNRPDLLDPALLRPGRFDRMIYLGVSDTHETQYNILEALTRKFRLDPSFNLRNFADQCPFNFTGADFYALSSDALLNAMSRKANELEKKLAELNIDPPKATQQRHPYPLTPQYYLTEMASPEDTTVLVTYEDFELALKSLIPSVSVQEMEHYKRIQQRFSQGFQS
ncbi:hypothetical protein AX16_004241 [Volvariella volvacea WC 439]|nr:hypothetical protein AX16_004241 [Volvariella volvacea WC 439]